MYPYPAEGRSLRPRSSRYSPYALYPLASNGYADQHYASSSQSGSHPRRYASASSSSSSPPRTAGSNVALSSSSSSNGRRRPRPVTSLPMPVPVPNLTKKSRGRHVPTASSLEDLRNAASGAGKKKRKEGDTARPHECQVDGCGKVFARGEHLKRHVRSLHTNEKPFLCKYPGCGKRFSRHDNLGQHTRVHKDYNPPDDLTIPDSESE
ncbi:hypothetical protein BDQ12DRAFT_598640 [Crucibulum laeve]|uniref:C2H2-type domain-containing protein n=1 Tax=Crucibulum laeve TaxID=68775 RepID=A0A5C3MBY2_9AGAR|nr:hypothetical protein BDQ12DRAFT_598640 [Crucibulum laeve]